MRGMLFFSGYTIVRSNARFATELLNLCLLEGISYGDFLIEENGDISFCCAGYVAKRLRRLCEAHGITLEIVKSGGLPTLVRRYCKRVGLLLGSILIVALLWLSERFVWDVRVVGNVSMTESEVLSELRGCGFGVGSYIPDLKTGEIENRVLIASDRISWISIYLNGTVAQVQVIERTLPPESDAGTLPANLVAACDGQIELLELYRGHSVVKIGQAVRKGELLVSGLYDSTQGGFRYTRAAGKVLARTERTFIVEIPLSYLERVYESPRCDQIDLIFFDFSLKIFKSTGNQGLICDIIKEEKGIDAFGLRALPFGLTVTSALPYTEHEASRTPEEALEMAYAELEHRLSALSDEVQLLRKDISTTLTETSLILSCTVSCIEDIAVQVEFEITQEP